MANTFEARFEGQCSACRNLIRAGDECGYDSADNLCHIECCDNVNWDFYFSGQ